MVRKAQKLDGMGYELNSVFTLEKVDWWDPKWSAAHFQEVGGALPRRYFKKRDHHHTSTKF
jgi:hypothetical protein